jgi:tRNA/rRNA methyltransferase
MNPMPEFVIVLVEPRVEGNIGAVARVMANFGAKSLALVRAPPIGEEARKRATRGSTVLDSARSCETLEEAIADVDLVVGTSEVATSREKRFLRIAVTPREFATRFASTDRTIALVFGREDFGLSVEDLERCDLLVTIPASPAYPVLNLSHAVAIALYEAYVGSRPMSAHREPSGPHREALHEAFSNLLAATNYPSHKRTRTKVMFRRMIGRAGLSAWEFHALMGVLQRATKRIKRLEADR